MNASVQNFLNLPSKNHGAGIVLTPEIVNLDGETQLRVSTPDAEDIIIPSSLLEALGANARQISSQLTEAVNEQRREAFHPTLRHELNKATRDAESGSVGVDRRSNTVALPGADIAADGTPYLFWKKDAEKPGWVLTLAGIRSASLGFAAWNDPAAIDELVASLSDPESLVTIAGMVVPTQTAEMTGRMVTRELRADRSIPTMEPKQIREILVSAGYVLSSDATSSTSRYSGGRVRALKINSGGKEVTVAIGVTMPTSFPWTTPLSEDERKLSWRDRGELERNRREEARAPYAKGFRAALAAAPGWRIVDLNTGRPGTNDIIWLTKISPETWSSVAAAATMFAGSLDMGRGSALMPPQSLPQAR